MAQRAGWEFQVRVGASNYVFVCKRYRSENESPPLDNSNSEGRPGNPAATNQNARGYGTNVKNLRRSRLVLEQATRDDSENPFAAPLSWKEGVYVNDLKIYPAGVATPAYVDTYNSLLITKVTREGEVGGLQPLTFEMVSDGQYD